MLHSAEEKELAALKQLFLLNAPLRIISSRKIHEAGPSFARLRHRCWFLWGVAFASLGFWVLCLASPLLGNCLAFWGFILEILLLVSFLF